MKAKAFIAGAIMLTLGSMELPSGWIVAGHSTYKYQIGIDKGAGQYDGNAVTIKSIETVTGGFGMLVQKCEARKYLGKRIKMSANMKSENVSDWAGLWFRVEGAQSQILTFDDMRNRPIKGNTAWKRCEIVLDIPLNARLLIYGGYLYGNGQVWFEEVSLEVVNNSVNTTNSINKIIVQPYDLLVETESVSTVRIDTISSTQSEPTNLNFK